MVPHKSARGAAALKRLELYEGVPPAQDKVKRVVVPAALRVLRLKPGRKYCTLKRVSHEVGWGYKDVVDRLEEKRKVKGKAYFERKVSLRQAHMRAQAGAPDLGGAVLICSKPLSSSEPRLPRLPRRTSSSPSTATRCTILRGRGWMMRGMHHDFCCVLVGCGCVDACQTMRMPAGLDSPVCCDKPKDV